MSSIQSRIAEIFLHLQFSNWSEGTIAQQRTRQEKTAQYMPVPRQVKCRAAEVNGVAAEWIEAPNPGPGVILYFHGGAYNLGSVNVNRELIARLAVATRSRALAINYRLAPENPFPAALEDAVSAYRWLLEQGSDSSQIIFAGDSAGGGLAIASLVAIRDSGTPLPAGAICISPWVDLALSGESIQVKSAVDPILNHTSLVQYAKEYAGDVPLTSPLISPLYADLENLPPLLIQVGTNEILLDDAKRIADKARQAGVEVTLEIWEGLFHVFHLFGFLPETQKATQQIVDFLSRTIHWKFGQ